MYVEGEKLGIFVIFPFPNVDLGIAGSYQCSKIRGAQHWGRRRAHFSENKGEKSEYNKFWKKIQEKGVLF